jgi:hypothetical protein
MNLAPVGNAQWRIVTVGDFNGDNISDIFWRNQATGQNLVWRSGNAAAPLAVASVPSLSWTVMGAGEFDAPDPDDPDPGGGYGY